MQKDIPQKSTLIGSAIRRVSSAEIKSSSYKIAQSSQQPQVIAGSSFRKAELIKFSVVATVITVILIILTFVIPS